MARPQAFAADVRVFLPKAETNARGFLARSAREFRDGIVTQSQARDGFPPVVQTIVNGQRGASEDAVRLPGPIIYTYDYRPAMVQFALGQLYRRSAVVSGAYRNSHAVFIDGVQVEGVPKVLPETAEIWIANTQSYARRLEGGYNENKDWFAQTQEPKLYEAVSVDLSKRFSSLTVIGFAYLTLPGAYVVKGGRRSLYSRRANSRGRASVGKPVTTPAITIAPLTRL